MEEGKKRNGKWKESNYVLGQPLAHAQSGADTREQNEIAEKSWVASFGSRQFFEKEESYTVLNG